MLNDQYTLSNAFLFYEVTDFYDLLLISLCINSSSLLIYYY